MPEIIINLSQRGGSHCRPLLAMLNREIGHDFIAKSGNRCLKLSTLLNWLELQVNSIVDLKKYWIGTNIHNNISILELVPLGYRPWTVEEQEAHYAKTGTYGACYSPVITDTLSVITEIVFESQKQEVQKQLIECALRIINKIKK